MYCPPRPPPGVNWRAVFKDLWPRRFLWASAVDDDAREPQDVAADGSVVKAAANLAEAAPDSINVLVRFRPKQVQPGDATSAAGEWHIGALCSVRSLRARDNGKAGGEGSLGIPSFCGRVFRQAATRKVARRFSCRCTSACSSSARGTPPKKSAAPRPTPPRTRAPRREARPRRKRLRRVRLVARWAPRPPRRLRPRAARPRLTRRRGARR